MKSAGALQVVIVLLLVASAASCEVAKEYSTRVFKPTIPQKDSTATALKFMQFDSENESDSIDLKDFASKEIKETTSGGFSKDSTVKTDTPPVIENKEVVVKSQPIDASKRGAPRNKRVRQ